MGKHPKNDIGINDIIKYNFADQERFLLQNSTQVSWITCLHITAPSVIEDGYDHFVVPTSTNLFLNFKMPLVQRKCQN